MSWPSGVERTGSPLGARLRARANPSPAEVVTALSELGELTGEPVTDARVSLNRKTLTSWHPDGGVAVWFAWDGAIRCIAVDLYREAERNLAAIAQIMRACSAEFQRGGLAGVRHALARYTPVSRRDASPSNGWHRILGVTERASEKEVNVAFRRRALDAHPDRGGDRRNWDELVAAYAESRKARRTLARREGRRDEVRKPSRASNLDERQWFEILALPNPRE